MAEVDPGTEGTLEGAGSPEVEGSQAGDEALAALGTEPQTLPKEVEEWLAKATPDKLPEGIRKKWMPELEKPFLSHFTKQQQALAKEKEILAAEKDQLLQIATAALQNKGIAPTPDTVAALKERIEAGEFNAIPQLVQETIQQQITPQLNQMKLQSMFSQAHEQFPILKDPEVSAQVQSAFSTNPTLAAMARVNNLEGTRFVLEGLAKDAMLMKVSAELEAQKKAHEVAMTKAKADAVAEYRAKVLGLPASTSRAGTTPKGQAKEEFLSFREAAEAALREQTG